MHTLNRAATVYKKVYVGYWKFPAVATLYLPAGTHINKALQDLGKNRASRARVVRIRTVPRRRQESRLVKRAYSLHDSLFIYNVGATVTPRWFDPSNRECAGGIHFFRRRIDARDYRP